MSLFSNHFNFKHFKLNILNELYEWHNTLRKQSCNWAKSCLLMVNFLCFKFYYFLKFYFYFNIVVENFVLAIMSSNVTNSKVGDSS